MLFGKVYCLIILIKTNDYNLYLLVIIIFPYVINLDKTRMTTFIKVKPRKSDD